MLKLQDILYVLIKGSDSIFEKTGYCYGASGYYAPSSLSMEQPQISSI